MREKQHTSLLIFDRKMMEEKKYWHDQLAQLPEPVCLPKYGIYSGRQEREVLSCGFGTLPQLEKITQGNPFLAFAALMASLKACLYRVSGRQEIVVGTPARGSCQGNALPMKDLLHGSLAFKELLRNVSLTLKQGYEHQRYPWERLIQDLDVEYDGLTTHPFFQISAAFDGFHGDRVPFAGEIFFRFAQDDEGIHCTVDFDPNIFDQETIRSFAGQIRNLLAAGLEDLEAPVHQLPLYEGKEIVSHGDAPAYTTPFPSRHPIHVLVAEQARCHPHGVALEWQSKEQGRLSYGDLVDRAGRLAAQLQAMGVSAETPVALYMERSPRLVVAMLAVLQAGGAYVPMDPEYPESRLRYMVEDVKPLVMLTGVDRVLPDLAIPVVRLEIQGAIAGDSPQTAAGPLANVDVDPGQAAYIIYTSGSTGNPKGVVISHGALLNLIYWHQDVFGVSRQDRATLLAGVAFDASVWELWPYLGAGATLCLPDPETLGNTELLRFWLVESGITVSFAPTPLAEVLLTLDWSSSKALRLLLTGGDVLQGYPPEGTPFTLVNNYGLTECTVVSTSGMVRPSKRTGKPPIGKAIANTAVPVFDTCLQPVTCGFPGELCIGGVSLARGYRGRPAMTAERFVPDPLNDRQRPGARLYKTGDLGRRLPDGNIDFLGRIDRQIQLRGYRIELGEIEARLQHHPEVREAVVILREDRPGDKQIVGYYTTFGQAADDQDAMDGYLRETLPDYMVPARLVVMEDWPTTAHGKIDRAALPPPVRGDETAFVAARTPGEEIIGGIWAEVLGLERISVQDNFFELGGHSLLATQVSSRLREIFAVDLSVRRIFEHPTVAGLARYIEQSEKGGYEMPPILPASRDQPLPASFAQQRLYFLQQLERESSAYNMSMAFQLEGDIKTSCLEQTFAFLVRRHEALRTTFTMEQGSLLQHVAEDVNVPFTIIDLSELTGATPMDQARPLMAREAANRFDLGRDPILRVTLMQLGDQRGILFVVMHHIASDGWSMGIMGREMAIVYQALSRGQNPDLPELGIHYADFALWQRRYLEGAYLEEQFTYWRGQLKGLPPLLELPWDRPRPGRLPARGAAFEFLVDPETVHLLEDVCRRARATLFMGLLAGFYILLARYSRREDLVVGSPVANRNRLETEPLIGFFVNTLVLRTDLSGNPSFLELLARVRATALGAYAHQDLPFDRLVDELQPQRSLSYSPLFQVSFALQNAPVQPLELKGLNISPLTFEQKTSKFDLTLVFSETPRGLKGKIQYHTDLFDERSVRRMMQQFRNLLAIAASRPEGGIGAYPLMDGEERDHLLQEWRQPRPVFSDHPMPHQAFELWVRRTPEAMALTMPGSPPQSLTYAEVNHRANRLAHLLISRGLRPGSWVGLFMAREPGTIIALLAVLKAGGAYVPLDPEAPDDRLGYMLDDAGVAFLLTGSNLRGRLSGRETLVLESLEPMLREQADHDPGLNIPGNAPIYCLYTSGTTGKPKGTLVSHENVVRLFSATDDWFSFREGDVWTLFHSLAFDFSVWEMWGALAHGGRLVIVPHWTSRSPEEFLRLLIEEKVTMLSQTPSAFRLLMEADLAAGSPPNELRWVVFGGEELDFQMLDSWFARHGDTSPRLANMFGITETTVHVTWYAVRADDHPQFSLIGEPIPDLGVYLLDPYLQPQPPGIPGELVVTGAGVSQGYLGRPALTAQRFLPDPFSPQPGARMYRSGDLSRRCKDGGLEYLGRLDHQVKLRGFRIELGEIETVLTGHPQVRHCAVLILGQDEDRSRLTAFVVAGEVNLDPEELRAFLSKTLPGYMVPSSFVQLEALPININGKLDQAALEQLAAETTATAPVHDHIPPRTPLEEKLAEIWTQVLRRPGVGVHDNFFALGGDSIRSIDVVTCAVRAGIHIEPRDVVMFQTIEKLATEVDRRQGDLPLPTVAAATAARATGAQGEHSPDAADLYPLTAMQQTMLDQYAAGAPGEGIYHGQHVYRMSEDGFSREAFTQALEILVAGEPILRTVIRRVDGKRWQAVLDKITLPLILTDLSGLSPGLRDKVIRDWIEDDLFHPLGVQHADSPMYRFQLFLESPRDFTFCIIIHHAIIDGWSHVVLKNRLFALYRQIKQGITPALPAVNHDYRRFVALEAEMVKSREVARWWERHLQFWEPMTPPDQAAGIGRRTTLRQLIDPELVAGLRRQQQAQAVSFKAVLLSAYLRTLRTDPTDPVTVGLVANGRTTRLERPLEAVGLFWNMVPIYSPPNGSADLLAFTHHHLVELEPYAAFPLREICRRKGVADLFFATFNFVQFHHQLPSGESDQLGKRGGHGLDRMHYPLNFALALHPTGDGLMLIVESDPRFFAEAQVEGIMSRYLQCLSEIAESSVD